MMERIKRAVRWYAHLDDARTNRYLSKRAQKNISIVLIFVVGICIAVYLYKGLVGAQ
jgi:hypothetical protein